MRKSGTAGSLLSPLDESGNGIQTFPSLFPAITVARLPVRDTRTILSRIIAIISSEKALDKLESRNEA